MCKGQRMVNIMLPIAVGSFCVIAAACDWDWFFCVLLRQSPLGQLLPGYIARPALRFLVAVLGTMVATLPSIALINGLG